MFPIHIHQDLFKVVHYCVFVGLKINDNTSGQTVRANFHLIQSYLCNQQCLVPGHVICYTRTRVGWSFDCNQ